MSAAARDGALSPEEERYAHYLESAPAPPSAPSAGPAPTMTDHDAAAATIGGEGVMEVDQTPSQANSAPSRRQPPPTR